MKYYLLMITCVLIAGCNANLKATKSSDQALALAQPSVNPNGGKALGLTKEGNITLPTQQTPKQQQPQQQIQRQPTQQPLVPTPTLKEAAKFPKKPAIPNVSTMNLATSKGEISIELYPKDAPSSIQNYINKAESGFYNNLKFHRVEDWVVQGGDPDGNGTGGGTMPTELSQRDFVEGSVGVARGSNIEISNDSQFFICTTDCSWLTGKYTLFGKVTEGMDVAKSIVVGDKIESIDIE